MSKSSGKSATESASKILKNGDSPKSSKSAAGSALSQWERQGVRVTTRDGVRILKPASKATHFSNRELRAAVTSVHESHKK